MLNRISERLDLEEEANTEAVISDDEAKDLVLGYIADRDVFYPSDIAYDLNLDYEQVCRILELLKSEGAIGDIE